MRSHLGAVTVVLAMLLSACSEAAEPPPASRTSEARSPTPENKENGRKDPQPDPFDPSNVDLELRTVAEGLEAPLGITNAGDGSNRLFVVEQGGRIVTLDLSTGTKTQFLDLSDQTVAEGEQGLLGLAFHPDFEENGRLFVNHTNLEGDTVIAEYGASPPSAPTVDPDTRRVLLEFDQPYANHNGGALAFGPDGALYIASGDGGSADDPHDNGQSLDTLLGKILRIDVDGEDGYGIPQDNPFVGEAEARPEIWAYGLRNPWRFSFDDTTNQLWIADVGQNELEEVNRVPADSSGLNFGWNEMEGSRCFEPPEGCDEQGKVIPITEYSHDQGCSITGGHVYRGEGFEDLVGGYFFGDFCEGTIWTIPADARAGAAPIEVLSTDHSISAFGPDENGELYMADLGGGMVLQLVDTKAP